MPARFVEKLAVTHISCNELAVRRDVAPQRAYADATGDKIPDLGPGVFCRASAEMEYLEKEASLSTLPL